MKKIVAFFALIAIYLPLCAQWKNATPYSASINDITFTDHYTGYAALTSSQIGNCSNTQSLNIYKTLDQGENWFLQNTGINASLSCIYFIDSYKAWAGNSNNLYSTIDGAQTWTLFSGSLGTGVNDIEFTSDQNGVLIGNNGAIRRTSNGGSTWQFITSGVTTNLNKLFFYNSQLGFIACQNGQLLRTTNGGANWSIISTGSTSLRDVAFISSSIGFAVGYVTNGYSVLKSIDGGLTWNVQQALTVGGYPLNKITFASATHGYIATGGKGIFRTSDGGNTWLQTETFNGENDNWQGLSFIDNNIGFACGSGGKINKTTDAGATWKSSACGSNTAFFKVWATNKKTAYAGGGSGIIHKTTNGGFTWKQKTKAFASSTINKIYFATDSIGFACSDSGRILKTSDAGEHWSLRPTNSLRFISDFSLINKDTGYASSQVGILFRTYNSGETWDSINTGFNDDLNAVYFVNNDTGFVTGVNTIYRTYNAGITWTATVVNNANYLTDIVFTNDSLGYCVGGFGKLLFTTDAGLNWYPTNNMSNNAEIEEISAVNDSVLYFARYGSQHFTLDSGKVIGSQSTACLFNNASMHSISMTNNGDNGYCTGGLSKNLVHIKEALELETLVGSNAFCAGSKISVACIARGYYFTGNTIEIQLSNASGSFSNPTVIGSYTPVPFVYQSGIVTATLPSNLPSGFYRIRATSSNPVVIGEDNGFDIAIQAQATPSLSLQSNITGATCAGTPFVFNAIAFAGGLAPSYQWFVNGIDINNNSSVYNTDTIQNNHQVSVVVTSSLTCISSSTAISNTYTATISDITVSAGNDTSVCVGEPFLLYASGGVQYNWNNATQLSNTNVANPTAIINSTTTFAVVVTDANGCSNSDTISINALEPPLPLTIEAIGNTVICQGTTVTLTGNTNGIWNTGTTNSTLEVMQAGTYFVNSSNSCGTVNSNSISITVNPLPTAAAIFANSASTFCQGDSVTLYGNIDGTWSTGQTSSSISVNESGIYSVTNTNSCGQAVSNTIEVLVNNLPVPIISFSNGILSSSPAVSYQWYYQGNSIDGATLQFYTPTQNGEYTVAITDENSCSALSPAENVVVTSLYSNSKEERIFHIQPNPAFQFIQIIGRQTYTISIQNALGEVLFAKNNCTASQTIDVSNFSAGIYIVTCNGAQQKFVKQ